ncbi:hypothetical protein CN271_23960 [Bacillus cereus]|nr:hypothetical protein CON59_20790 [Bacillus cereus]PET45536.1 hypothetical protein CN523_15760 [Bacillus cereus]PEV81869.1 hypothetical protein CN429_15150 [Bacillus cereus]PFA49434.1 hypothetical protein CN389_24895 [Bacillus cereus]PFD65854.1 hypothetical protein CN271_23960 [Bacillus cereus]
MLDYIWLDDKSPILEQLPSTFKSAAILLHPFVQMPLGWEKSVRKRPYEHIYPSAEEIIHNGKSVSWKEMMSYSGLHSYAELAMAMLTSIGAYTEEYKREDLAKKLYSNLKKDLYYPTEDYTSIFLLHKLLKLLGSKGAKNLYFSEPILDTNGLLEVNNTTPLDIWDISNNEYAFMSIFDSFTTLLLAKEENIEYIVHSMNVEAVICDKKTMIDWYF